MFYKNTILDRHASGINWHFWMPEQVPHDEIEEDFKKSGRAIALAFAFSTICHLLLALFIIFIAGKYINRSNPLSAINVRLVSMPGYFSGSGLINFKKPNEQLKEAKKKKPVSLVSEIKSKAPEPVKEKTKPKKIFTNEIYKIEEQVKTDKKDLDKPASVLLSEKSNFADGKSVLGNVDIASTRNVKEAGNGKEPEVGPGVYDSEHIDRPLRPLVEINPVYPMRARRLGIEGWVVIKMLVSEKGSIENVEVLEAQPRDIFEKSVLESAAQGRFPPPTVNGEPVKAFLKATVRFKLKD